jgi:hypothetical protein
MSSCSYSTLQGTYSCGSGGCAAPALAGVPSMNSQTVLAVPTFGAGYGYSALTHGEGAPGCSGYFGLAKAYPTNCPALVARQCQVVGTQSYANLQ